MKRKKRVSKGRKISRLRASAGVEKRNLTNEPELWQAWRDRQKKLEHWRQLPKKRVTLKLDADVVAWFREMGRGYQWEINRALRTVMEEERSAHSKGQETARSD